MSATHRSLIVGFVITLALTIYAPPALHGQSATTSSPARKTITVPFVGCESDGQAGPVKAPTGRHKVVQISAEAAQQLAYYKSEYGSGVLAPRDWYCFSTYGSNGSNLFVSPKPITSAELFSDSWKGFAGPAIQVSISLGDTSGRFRVAQVIARIFPAYKKFAEQVAEEKIEPASSFPFGSYPKDKLNYRSKNIAEYITPGNVEGLGTNSRLERNANPISGVAILIGQTPDLLQLSMRLPKEQRDLCAIIIQQAERDAAHFTSE